MGEEEEEEEEEEEQEQEEQEEQEQEEQEQEEQEEQEEYHPLKFFCCKRNKNFFLCLIFNCKVKHIAMQPQRRVQSWG